MNRSEEGSTLVEILVAIVILGTAVTAVLGALATGIDLSAVDRTHAEAEAALRSYAETVHAAEFVACAPAASYDFDVSDDITITTVEYWVEVVGDPFITACPGATLDLAHRITIHLDTDDARVGPFELQVVKRGVA